MSLKKFDAIIIGCGPAGCSAALKLKKEGLNPIIIEKKNLPREKICGGILTTAASDFIEDYLDIEMETEFQENPKELGLFYSPPSGIKNGGIVKNYVLYNIDRRKFDFWFSKKIIEADIKLYTNEIVKEIKQKDNQIIVKTNKGKKISSKYLIGSDGVKSNVRRILFKEKQKCAPIYQEFYLINEEIKKKIEPNFYIFLNGEISSLYSYIIPKKDNLILGIGDYKISKNLNEIKSIMKKFKNLIKTEMNNIYPIISREPISKKLWFIPFSKPFIGHNNILLAGDAAGIINCFSGEGIRLALETGYYAAEAILEVYKENIFDAKKIYKKLIDQIINFSIETRKFAISMDNNKREDFLKGMNLKK